jgi:ribose transport system substrate-binding protein
VVPTGITQTKPLSAKPPTKKVGFVVCADPSCEILSSYLKEAIGSFGWDLVTVNAPPTDPGSAVQQLIDAGVDYIGETGINMDQFQSQADELKSKGIPLFECYATDVPAGESNNLYSDCFDASAADQYGAALADWVIADSGGKAHTVIMNLPAFPILSAQGDAVKKELAANCPDCTADLLEPTIDDLTSGNLPNLLVSYLQKHPDVNYIYETFEGFDLTGISAAVAGANLQDKVKIVGEQAFSAEMQEIIDGKEHAWSELPEELSMWSMADQMARLANNEWTVENERANAIPPFFIIDSVDVAKQMVDLKYGWPGPEGFKDAYKKLWGV